MKFFSPSLFTLSTFLALGLLATPAQAYVGVSAVCPAPLPDPMPFDAMAGTRSKWQMPDKNMPGLTFDERLKIMDGRASIQPDLNNLWLSDWMNNVEKQGINTLDLNIDVSKILATNESDIVSQEDWMHYLKNLYGMPQLINQKNKTEIDFVAGVRDHMLHGSAYEYSQDQRDQALIYFLKRLENL